MTRIYEYAGPEASAEPNAHPLDAYRLLELPERKDRYGATAAYKPDEFGFMNDGLCREYAPGLFDTDTNKGKTSMRGKGTYVINGRTLSRKEQIGMAKEVCGLCPVLEECSAFIKRYPEREGVWAGTIPEERR